MMNFLGLGGSASDTEHKEDQPHEGKSELLEDKQEGALHPMPMFALDSIKHAGVPLQVQMTPYLQMDPSIFRNAQPQYIMPEGNEHGRGKFELVLGHIGIGVGAGFSVGCLRGFSSELRSVETRNLMMRPYMTRLANATIKHGSGFAQSTGVAVFLYSAINVGLKFARADDDLNSFFAGAMAGALYRSPYGMRASLIGSAFALGAVTAMNIINPDSRQRLNDMFHFL